MGRLKGAYREEFPVGTRVRVKDVAELERFRRDWKLHHPLTEDQMAFSGREATVEGVAFYHGGDELYTLSGIPGMWHEQLLDPIQSSDADSQPSR